MAQQPRVNNDFLTTWQDFVEFLPAAPLFKKWGGIFLIAAMLTRKVWVRTDPTYPPIYPVLFVTFAGQPASGKDMVINTVRRLLELASEGMAPNTGINLGPESISVKGLVDALADEDAELTFTFRNGNKKEVVKYHSLVICLGELGTFMPEYNTQLISVLNDLYNCKPSFSDRVRGRGLVSSVKIANPHVALLLGTQPATLADIVPEQAYQMGFTSRINMIVAKEIIRLPMYDQAREDRSHLEGKLVSDLRSIAALTGPFRVTSDFKKLMNEFHLTNPNPIKHTRFLDYNARRSLHLHKLAMVNSVSHSNNLTLTEEDFTQAKAWLFESEEVAPSVFDDLTSSAGFSHSIEQALNHNGATISQAELIRKLRRTHKPQEVGAILKSMQLAEDIIVSHHQGNMPIYHITPTGKDKLS